MKIMPQRAGSSILVKTVCTMKMVGNVQKFHNCMRITWT